MTTNDINVYTCDKFCASLGYTCYEAYKEASEDSSCPVRSGNVMDCSGPSNNDYICGCEKEGEAQPLSIKFIGTIYNIL